MRSTSQLHEKRKNLNLSIRKEHMNNFFEIKRANILLSRKEEQQIEEIHFQIKNIEHYFRDKKRLFQHMKVALSILKKDFWDKTIITALLVLRLIFSQNQEAYFTKMISFQPDFLSILVEKLYSSSSRVTLQLLNLLNWLAAHYESQCHLALNELNIIDLLSKMVEIKYGDVSILRLAINLIENMINKQTVNQIASHSVAPYIVSLMNNSTVSIRVQAYSAVLILLQNLRPLQARQFVKQFNVLSIVSLHIQYLEVSSHQTTYLGLLIIKKYIEVSQDNREGNKAMQELHNVYNVKPILEKLTFDQTYQKIKVQEAASELLDIMGQCVFMQNDL